jgi:3-oxoacyl-[acyl-carrier-protein] synthase-3
VIAFNTAQAYIRAGIYKTILVVGAESMSRLVDWSDRSTSVLFGDGAGAPYSSGRSGDKDIFFLHCFRTFQNN